MNLQLKTYDQKETTTLLQIEKVLAYEILLPFAVNFTHAKSKEDFSKNLIVEVISSDDGIVGYGEGAPRFYSSDGPNEISLTNISEFLKKESFPWKLENISSIWNFVDSLPDNTNSNSIVCALEMALLDAFGKSMEKYIMDFFKKDFSTEKIYYGATIPLADRQKVEQLSRLTREIGIKHLRIKMDRDANKNREALEAVKSVYEDDCEIRIDPNGSWNREIAFQHLSLIRDSSIKIVEEPIMNDDKSLKLFFEKIKHSGAILMACQSAPTFVEVEKITREGIYGMVNVKLSRCGGFRRALRIIDLLRDKGVAFQIGCHRGESGILSSAGRILGLLSKDARYYDGSYDSFLLKENTTAEDVTFGRGGEAGPLEGPGLGVNVVSERLTRLSDRSTKITVTRH
jgi:muconate cycloisomerase